MTYWGEWSAGRGNQVGRTTQNIAGAGALLLVIIAVMLATACSQPVVLKGTDLGKEPAPEFRLVDQRGKEVALSDLRGRVVVLTFLYTRCPDVCPLIAERLSLVGEQLGNDANHVTFVAISVDPENDTPQAIETFDRQHRLNGKLVYLNGPRQQLESVWKNYYVAAEAGIDHAEEIAHSTRIVVIDKAGRQRVNLAADFEPADLVHNVRGLLNEG